MMEAASTSETSVIYQSTRRYNPEDNHLQTRRRDSLKSYFLSFSVYGVGECCGTYQNVGTNISVQHQYEKCIRVNKIQMLFWCMLAQKSPVQTFLCVEFIHKQITDAINA
jgi:hypothetical protein